MSFHLGMTVTCECDIQGSAVADFWSVPIAFLIQPNEANGRRQNLTLPSHLLTIRETHITPHLDFLSPRLPSSPRIQLLHNLSAFHYAGMLS
jgi:hypothetical protein